MLKKITGVTAAAVVGIAATVAGAQNAAVQWRVEDGGNGHWYKVVNLAGTGKVDWSNSRASAIDIGGDLACFTSEAETSAFLSLTAGQTRGNPWIGLFQDHSAPDFSEPAGGWRWASGEPLMWTNWATSEPNNAGSEDWVNMWIDNGPQGTWNDYRPTNPQGPDGFIIEWSADCNNDGIVDYGQCQGGLLTDTSGNNIPDCCEQGINCSTTANGLEAYLKFEGNSLDSSGNGRHGSATAMTYRNGPSATVGLAGNFDGLNSDVRIEGIPIPTNNQFSWALWFRTETIGQIALIERIESIGNNLLTPSLFIRSNGGLGFGSYSFASGGSSIETGPSVVSPGAWIHVACTSATTGLRQLYVNGQLVGENYSADYGQPLALMLLGRDRLDCCDRFRGMMDEVRVYSRALTPAEVSDLFQQVRLVDCNSDGINDAQQIAHGQLPDYNGNTIPDCCDRGEACVVGNYPVQWRTEVGGNGHWYSGVDLGHPVFWVEARDMASARGGHLATPSAAGEDRFLVTKFLENARLYRPDYSCCEGPYIGAFNDGAGWKWVDGTPWSYTNWCPGNPNEIPFNVVVYWARPECQWQDQNDVLPEYKAVAYMIEWSADCNNDNIVDYGQILIGQLADTNTNGIPDICEVPTCRDVDLFRNGVINGADLGILLSEWGPASANTVSDINRDGRVDGSDLGTMLAFWGPCGG